MLVCEFKASLDCLESPRSAGAIRRSVRQLCMVLQAVAPALTELGQVDGWNVKTCQSNLTKLSQKIVLKGWSWECGTVGRTVAWHA